MEVLNKVAYGAVTNQTPLPPLPVQEGDSSAQPAAVHALNILRALYRDSRLGDHMMPFVPEGVRIAITGFAANLWPVCMFMQELL